MQEAPLLFHISGIPAHVTYAWVAMIILLSVAVIVRTSLKIVPAGVQNFVEVVVEFFLNLAESSIGHMGRFFFPLIATLGMYILVCNFLGLIPGFEAPTANLNTNAAMAIPVFLATHYYGVKIHGLGYFKHFIGPIRSIFALPLMILIFFIEVLSHVARPLTLSVRLFGNMMAKHLLLLILAILTPWIVPVSILTLGVLVSIVQALVFTFLTATYLAGAVEEAH
jgi:F-type H+-transporting ATPase subunit a